MERMDASPKHLPSRPLTSTDAYRASQLPKTPGQAQTMLDPSTGMGKPS